VDSLLSLQLTKLELSATFHFMTIHETNTTIKNSFMLVVALI